MEGEPLRFAFLYWWAFRMLDCSGTVGCLSASSLMPGFKEVVSSPTTFMD